MVAEFFDPKALSSGLGDNRALAGKKFARVGRSLRDYSAMVARPTQANLDNHLFSPGFLILTSGASFFFWASSDSGSPTYFRKSRMASALMGVCFILFPYRRGPFEPRLVGCLLVRVGEQRVEKEAGVRGIVDR